MSTENRQCRKCPWKTSTDPREIPNGYCAVKHAALAGTIARPGSVAGLGGPLRMMACHESALGADRVCVGWLSHQLGPGNNIGLRLAAMSGRFGEIVLDGEQHETFEATLPKRRGGRGKR